MINKNLLYQVAVTVAVSGMMLTAIADLTFAATMLRNGQTANGFIQSTSSSFTYGNRSKRGVPTENAYGEEYTFNANQDDSIVVSVEKEDGSALLPVIILISPNNTQVAYDDVASLLRYRIPATGQYQLRVLGRNNTLGRYRLSVSGISRSAVAQTTSHRGNNARRQLLQKEFGLTALDSCPAATSDLAVVSFVESSQIYRYCANPTRLVKAGEYTYDAASGELKPGIPVAQTSYDPATDSRRQLLQKEYGLTVLDNCPTATSSLVVVSFPEAGQIYRYCANPTRLLKAGEYTYDQAISDLKPGTPVAQNPTSTQTTDSRRQTLQSDFGLTVLDNCPAARSSLVVANFPEGNQIYTYCANPNRIFAAGEYTYNVSTRSLDPATKPATDRPCFVTIPGTNICVVR